MNIQEERKLQVEIAKLARERLFNDKAADFTGILILEAGKQIDLYESDYEMIFKQENNFLYFTGCHEPGYVAVLDFDNKKYYLCPPRQSPALEMWCGPNPSIESTMEKYQPDESMFADDIIEFIKTDLKPSAIHAVKHTTSADIMSKLQFEWNLEDIEWQMNECRLYKFAQEIEWLRKAAVLTSDGFRAAMKPIQPGTMENAIEMRLWNECRSQTPACRHYAFAPIAASGMNPATLHYVKNDDLIDTEKLFLLDAGAEYFGYAGDITRTFPPTGKFNEHQKNLYEVVLKANVESIKMCKPGVLWEDVHILTERIIAEGLIELGILKGDLEEVLAKHVVNGFYLHGLGHLLGLAVHDVGGYPKGVERINRPGIMYLRMRRVLEEGMAMTTEPGCYFNDAFIQPLLDNPETAMHIDTEVLAEYRKHVAGIRIEDDLLITSDGVEVMTNAPKTVEEIEAHMAQ
ncbi:hypothetical protein PCE1_002615 [Barthelona sp. PCE]